MTTSGSVLVVEDDPSLRALYVEILRDEGWHVLQAGDGVEALQVLESARRPCVAIVDLRMPRMDGWQLAPHLRERGLPFVVVAAHYRIQDEAAEVGTRWWLQKPVAIDRLIDIVRRACLSECVA